MMTKREGYQLSLFTTSMEELVPGDHFLRQIEAAVDFRFIYDELAPYYSANNGKPSVDPVVIVKQLLIAFLYGILSERRLEEECKYNVAYRWFLISQRKIACDRQFAYESKRRETVANKGFGRARSGRIFRAA